MSFSSQDLRKTVMGPLRRQIYETIDVKACLFRARMRICADGAPRAYHPAPDDWKGLDDLAWSGLPGTPWAIALDAAGKPCIQGDDEPAPGFYVSTTALSDPDVDETRQDAYIDASAINYIVLPSERFHEFTRDPPLVLGDVGFVYSLVTKKFGFAIFGETGPSDEIGEASLHLVIQLGMEYRADDAREGGTEKPQLIYGLFPGSGNGRPLPQAEIEAKASRLFKRWGGMERLLELVPLIR